MSENPDTGWRVGAAASLQLLAASPMAAAAGNEIPVEPGRRSPELDFRIALHESGHVIVGLAMGSPIGGCTITPGKNFSGLTWGPSGDPLKYCSADKVGLCTNIARLMPSIGEARADCAELIIHAHGRAVELVAGTEAERLLYLDAPPLTAEHDLSEARNFAEIVCRTPLAVDSFINFARQEARVLIDMHRNAVLPLAAELVARRTLNGDQINAVVSAAIAADELAAEKARREKWQQITANAEAFRVSQ